MFENKIFESALAIQSSWYIKDIKFDQQQKLLDIYVDFKRGSTFFSEKSDCTEKYKVKDTVQKRWRHLIFFEHGMLYSLQMSMFLGVVGSIKS